MSAPLPALHVEGVHRDMTAPRAVVSFNRALTSDEVLALHRLLVHYVNAPAAADDRSAA